MGFDDGMLGLATPLAMLAYGRSPRTAIDLREDSEGFRCTIPVPGVRSQDLSITISDRTLRVKGETNRDSRHASFDRTVQLPEEADVANERASVQHEDGLLLIFVPKRASASRQLQVQQTSSSEPSASGDPMQVGGESATSSGYHLTIAAPGVRGSDLSIRCEGRLLHVKGETDRKGRHARVDRSLWLPNDADASSELVSVVHEDGLISLFVPKRDRPEPRQLHIESAAIAA